jgi:hypothetical protein
MGRRDVWSMWRHRSPIGIVIVVIVSGLCLVFI